MTNQTVTNLPTVTEISDLLKARAEQVARAYAPGGKTIATRYWAVCPWRDDKAANSFYISLSGAYLGRFRDEATLEMGDMLDLIRLALCTDMKGALIEARSFLGMVNETPEQRRLRQRAAQNAKAASAQAAHVARIKAVERSRAAQGLYLRAIEDWRGTPIEWYLGARGITLARLGRLPRSIRYHPKLRYGFTDSATGEIFDGEYPAMVTAVYGPTIKGARPQFQTVHKTFLQAQPDADWWAKHQPEMILHPDPARRFWKADVPRAKLFFTGAPKKAGFVRLWPGTGPRGGKGAPLSLSAGRVWITEGIEDGLAAAALDPTRRVLAAGDLGNIQFVTLPEAITSVVVVADNDDGERQIALVDKAVEVFRAMGKSVSVWRNPWGGKDLNDGLLLALKNEGEHADT